MAAASKHRRVNPRLALLACWLLLPDVGHARSNDDQAIYDLIDSIRPAAQAVQIDGANSDWQQIPSFPDPAGDAGGDASRDIVSVSIAPLADSWLVQIETAGNPSQQDLAFWLFIDYRSQQVLDLELGLYLGFPDVLWRYPEGGQAVMSNWDETVTVIGNVVEARIPLAELALELPAEMAADLSGSDARSWVRVTPFTRNLQGEIVDYGAAVGSYRLLTTPFTLDPDLPTVPGKDPPAPAIPLPLPLEGMQYVDQGAGGIFSHSATWGYDFNRVNQSLHPDDPHMSTDNNDYFSFGEPIRAPVDATVFSLDNQNPDLPPRPDPCNFQPVNFVFLNIGNGVSVLFSHTMQGSIPVQQGNPVGPGDLIGNIGHSGSCSWAHLHLEAQSIGGDFPSRPIELTGVDVGLNPVEDDPWLRRFNRWGIREGFLVRTATESCSGRSVPVSELVYCNSFEAD